MKPQVLARTFALLFMALASVGCDGGASPKQPSPTPTATAQNQAQSPTQKPAVLLRHRVYFLGGANPADTTLPTIVAIHGLGDRPSAFRHLYDGFDVPSRLLVPAGPIPHGNGFSWFPVRVRGSQASRVAPGVNRAVEQLMTWFVKELGPEVKNRAVVTGFSQGGMLTLAVASQYPNRVVGALPIAGWLPKPLWQQARPYALQIEAFHGLSDPVLPWERTAPGLDELERLGFKVQRHTYPGLGHRISPDMRAAYFQALRRLVSAP